MPGSTAGEAGAKPRHVAIIMDGNGRWAAARGLPRGEGHRRGVEAVRRTVRAALDLGIGHITLFSFSSENWSRPPTEVDFLFSLFRLYIRRDVAELHAQGVRISVIGRRDGLPADILGMIEETERLTAGNRRLELIFAFNYGSRDEIVRAVRSIAREAVAGRLDPGAIEEATISAHLDTACVPGPGPDRAHQRRTPPEQLPVVAVGLRRAGVSAGVLARFRPRGPGGRDRRIRQADAPLRRGESASRMSAEPIAPSPWQAVFDRQVGIRAASGLALAVIAVASAVLGEWWAAVVAGVVTVAIHQEWTWLTEERRRPAIYYTVGLVIAIAYIAAGLPTTGVVLVGHRRRHRGRFQR